MKEMPKTVTNAGGNSVDGDFQASGNISGAYMLGNGAFLTGLVVSSGGGGGGQFTGDNLTVSGNVTANNATFGNNIVVFGNIGVRVQPLFPLHVVGNAFVQGNVLANGVIVSSATTSSFTGAGFVGVGTSTPTERLHVAGNAFVQGNVVANGVIVSSATNSSFTGAGFVGVGTSAPSERLHVYGNILVNNGSVGIGLESVGILNPQANLHVIGNIIATGDVVSSVSDARLKTAIRTIDCPLDRLSLLRGVFYSLNDLAESYGLHGADLVGVLAQDVEQALPQAVRPAPFDIGDGGASRSGQDFKTVLYDRLVPLVIEGVLELQRQVAELQRQVAELQRQVAELQRQRHG
jgi:hypothetical protein